MNIIEKPNIDPENKIEREVNGCKVRLFFSLVPNESAMRLALDNLMLSFDTKMQELSKVQS